jgi:hypothetical protein
MTLLIYLLIRDTRNHDCKETSRNLQDEGFDSIESKTHELRVMQKSHVGQCNNHSEYGYIFQALHNMWLKKKVYCIMNRGGGIRFNTLQDGQIKRQHHSHNRVNSVTLSETNITMTQSTNIQNCKIRVIEREI